MKWGCYMDELLDFHLPLYKIWSCKMNKEKTQLELELLAQVKLLEAEKVFLENQLNNAIAKIAILKGMP
ncbi:MAG: hypothetical protein ACI9ES_003615 [Oceanospirillaceae bacterium]|jgi:hypothetical protein